MGSEELFQVKVFTHWMHFLCQYFHSGCKYRTAKKRPFNFWFALWTNASSDHVCRGFRHLVRLPQQQHQQQCLKCGWQTRFSLFNSKSASQQVWQYRDASFCKRVSKLSHQLPKRHPEPAGVQFQLIYEGGETLPLYYHFVGGDAPKPFILSCQNVLTNSFFSVFPMQTHVAAGVKSFAKFLPTDHKVKDISIRTVKGMEKNT